MNTYRIRQALGIALYAAAAVALVANVADRHLIPPPAFAVVAFALFFGTALLGIPREGPTF